MELTEQQKKFVDAFLETSSIEASAVIAGLPKTDARKQAIDWLANEFIQEYIKKREEVFKKVSEVQKLDKDKLLRSMYYQYGKANTLNKTKEATEILEKIARWNGVEPDKLNLDQPNVTFNNLDGENI